MGLIDDVRRTPYLVNSSKDRAYCYFQIKLRYFRPMERAEYLRMAAVEGSFWWYRALHAVLADELDGANIAPGARLLDAGCGTGGLLCNLAAAKRDLILFGVEIDPEAARIAAAKSRAAVTIGSVNGLPYPDTYFDVLVSADVLCHAAVQQRIALAEMRRCLKPGGILLLNLPAYRWMLSAHDRHVHNTRRYTASEASRMVTTSGFRVVKAFYWNSLLFPLMASYRLTVGRQQASSDLRSVSAVQDSLFFTIITLERKLARYRLRLPFGGSVFIGARRP
jgi:SAM-dependent methyltransferase